MDDRKDGPFGRAESEGASAPAPLPARPRRAKRYASSVDVARLAGVSQSAVSRTYRSGASVSEETRRKVLAAAERLDYRPSLIPRIMLTSRSNLIAVVVGGLYNPFYATVLEQFTQKLQDTGHQVLLVHVDSGHGLDAVIPRLASYRVDAVVSALAVLSPSAAEQLTTLKIPVITFNTAFRSEWIVPVSCDNAGASVEIADLFLARGARSFGFVSGPPTSHASAVRLRSFEERLRERAGASVVVSGDDYRYESGYAAVLGLYAGGKGPEALFCANDLIAFGAIDALRRVHRMRVPQDVMVAGFDDIPAASWAAYDLTTFVQDGVRMVDQAMALLSRAEAGERIGGGDPTTVPARLVERGTTRRLAGEAEATGHGRPDLSLP
jgi:DNA-binding LacI/PurR family transcriptional regulator